MRRNRQTEADSQDGRGGLEAQEARDACDGRGRLGRRRTRKPTAPGWSGLLDVPVEPHKGAGAEESDGRDSTKGKGPRAYTFLPWLLMGMGALSNIISGKSQNTWLAGVGLLAFNSLYIFVVFSAFNPRYRDSRVPVYGLAALTAVTYTISIAFGHAWLLFFPLLSLASGAVRAIRGKPHFILLFVLSGSAGTIAGRLVGDHWEAAAIGYGTFISGMVTATVLSLFDTVKQLDATRQELARTAVEKERLRFSRDLHDLLGHTLSVIVVKAEAVRRLAPRDLDAALAQTADIEAVGRQALTEIREAVTGYREGSLSTELDRARSALEGAGIEPVVRQSGPPLPPQASALLGWVVREGVTNTVRHSGATRCEIEVRTDAAGDRARLTVTDDGHGPAPAATPPVTGGTGLKGLTERLAAAGGTLDTGPDGRRGFRLVAELPLGGEEPMRR
ncbi:two-component sensor histidine kinase [Streptomyces paromomycinus]|uniref:Two-component sensor histidine kinase n=1 Tax=Streptomyces paromomycinus TaxID=92743 RepID=A0A401WAB8_STREY|nr:sensor histidine kinase [Streptomyces paromomycinus]GCD46248.1 two-component sensor histidine kinase [Streptomyces paromomycinus]